MPLKRPPTPRLRVQAKERAKGRTVSLVPEVWLANNLGKLIGGLGILIIVITSLMIGPNV